MYYCTDCKYMLDVIDYENDPGDAIRCYKCGEFASFYIHKKECINCKDKPGLINNFLNIDEIDELELIILLLKSCYNEYGCNNSIIEKLESYQQKLKERIIKNENNIS